MPRPLPPTWRVVLGSLLTCASIAAWETLQAQQRGPALIVPPTNAPQPRGPSPAPSLTPTLPTPAHGMIAVDGDLLTPDEAVNVMVYDRCNRSAVNISTKAVRLRESFLSVVPEVEAGSGSGAVLDKSGHILTNFHVVEGAKEIEVTLFNEKSYPASPVGADPAYDIAILKIDAPEEALYPVTLGSSERLRVGMRCFALGNPFGLDRTMSQGIISSLNRTLEVRENWTIKSIIQIDAAVNPGNSGGPLLDTQARMIGMNVAIATRLGAEYGQSAGIGFAIPVDLIKRIVPELIQHGRVIRGELGVTHVTETENGLRIVQMEPGGPAERAGLRGPQTARERRGPFMVERVDRSRADVIVAIDGQPVGSAAEFHSVLEGKRPGDKVTLTLLREGNTINVPVVLGGDGAAPPPTRALPL
ncbi:MAG: S1C family serine protease [Planctomycetaceae bacterium]